MRSFLLSYIFFFKLALSKADKMKPDWTLNNKGSCKGTALWLILCSFNKLSAKNHILVQSERHSLSLCLASLTLLDFTLTKPGSHVQTADTPDHRNMWKNTKAPNSRRVLCQSVLLAVDRGAVCLCPHTPHYDFNRAEEKKVSWWNHFYLSVEVLKKITNAHHEICLKWPTNCCNYGSEWSFLNYSFNGWIISFLLYFGVLVSHCLLLRVCYIDW